MGRGKRTTTTTTRPRGFAQPGWRLSEEHLVEIASTASGARHFFRCSCGVEGTKRKSERNDLALSDIRRHLENRGLIPSLMAFGVAMFQRAMETGDERGFWYPEDAYRTDVSEERRKLARERLAWVAAEGSFSWPPDERLLALMSDAADSAGL